MQLKTEVFKHRPNFDSMLGKKYGRLTCVSLVGREYKDETSNYFRYIWRYQCDCGRFVDMPAKNVRRAQLPSCGCAVRERAAAKFLKHGKHKSTEYTVWQAIKNRTLRITAKDFAKYGAVGIGICDEWLSFENFLRDMGPRPSPKHSIDRIDNAKGYSKENCRWADATTQCRNKTNNAKLTAFGQTKLLVEWAEQLGVSTAVIRQRLKKYGWAPEKAVSTPARVWCPKQPRVKEMKND